MTPYKAEDYINLIEQGRRDKVSPEGLKLIAERFRALEKVASGEHIKWLLDRHFIMSEELILALEYMALPWYKRIFAKRPNIPIKEFYNE